MEKNVQTITFLPVWSSWNFIFSLKHLFSIFDCYIKFSSAAMLMTLWRHLWRHNVAGLHDILTVPCPRIHTHFFPKKHLITWLHTLNVAVAGLNTVHLSLVTYIIFMQYCMLQIMKMYFRTRCRSTHLKLPTLFSALKDQTVNIFKGARLCILMFKCRTKSISQYCNSLNRGIVLSCEHYMVVPV